MSTPAIDLRAIYLARQTIAGLARRTPLIHSAYLSEQCQTNVYLKLENLQETGAFKLRGAANRLLNLSPAERQRGVVTVSTGNHGRGVAFVAQKLGMRAVICVPELVLPHKVAAMRKLGAEVVIHGPTQDDAELYALQLAQSDGLTMVSPFDDPYIIAGQGTIGLELLEDLPQIDTVIIPLSGGGLLAGIALALKTARPDLRVIGASQALGPAMHLSLQAGKVVPVIEEKTLADSLMGGIGLENHFTFALCQRFVDEVILLSEAEIGATMAFALRQEHQVVEGGGAVGIGALLHNKVAKLGRNVVVIVSGGNADMPTLMRLTAH
ncbi:MAG: hydroxyectoine utilization dehydratase EutB [Chloroflexi bacterium]|nr:hydroxyectoine utilization dehydratase EutB [Chloroflexota bacterium]